MMTVLRAHGSSIHGHTGIMGRRGALLECILAIDSADRSDYFLWRQRVDRALGVEANLDWAIVVGPARDRDEERVKGVVVDSLIWRKGIGGVITTGYYCLVAVERSQASIVGYDRHMLADIAKKLDLIKIKDPRTWTYYYIPDPKLIPELKNPKMSKQNLKLIDPFFWESVKRVNHYLTPKQYRTLIAEPTEKHSLMVFTRRKKLDASLSKYREEYARPQHDSEIFGLPVRSSSVYVTKKNAIWNTLDDNGDPATKAEGPSFSNPKLKTVTGSPTKQNAQLVDQAALPLDNNLLFEFVSTLDKVNKAAPLSMFQGMYLANSIDAMLKSDAMVEKENDPAPTFISQRNSSKPNFASPNLHVPEGHNRVRLNLLGMSENIIKSEASQSSFVNMDKSAQAKSQSLDKVSPKSQKKDPSPVGSIKEKNQKEIVVEKKTSPKRLAGAVRLLLPGVLKMRKLISQSPEDRSSHRGHILKQYSKKGLNTASPKKYSGFKTAPNNSSSNLRGEFTKNNRNDNDGGELRNVSIKYPNPLEEDFVDKDSWSDHSEIIRKPRIENKPNKDGLILEDYSFKKNLQTFFKVQKRDRQNKIKKGESVSDNMEAEPDLKPLESAAEPKTSLRLLVKLNRNITQKEKSCQKRREEALEVLDMIKPQMSSIVFGDNPTASILNKASKIAKRESKNSSRSNLIKNSLPEVDRLSKAKVNETSVRFIEPFNHGRVATLGSEQDETESIQVFGEPNTP